MTRVRRGGKPPEDDTFVMSRSEDRSIWIRTAYLLEKYKLLVWVVFIALLAFGFDFKTPRMIVQDLQGQITANKKQVDSTVIPRVDRLDSKMDILLRLRCADTSISERLKDLAGLTDFCSHQSLGGR